jgi:hypothetical protein
MTVLTLKSFAIKLGFKKASDPIFRQLLRTWEIEGSVHVYQGGYLGHSSAHPKKVAFSKELETYVNQTKGIPQPKTFYLLDYEDTLKTKNMKIVSAQNGHNCSNCNEFFFHKSYVSSSIFFSLKICKKCIQKLFDEGTLTINVPYKRLGTITVVIKRDE